MNKNISDNCELFLITTDEDTFKTTCMNSNYKNRRLQLLGELDELDPYENDIYNIPYKSIIKEEYIINKDNIKNEDIKFAKFEFVFHTITNTITKEKKVFFKIEHFIKLIENYIKDHKNLRAIEIKWIPCFGVQIGLDNLSFQKALGNIAKKYHNINFLFSKTQKNSTTTVISDTTHIDNKKNRVNFFFKNGYFNEKKRKKFLEIKHKLRDSVEDNKNKQKFNEIKSFLKKKRKFPKNTSNDKKTINGSEINLI